MKSALEVLFLRIPVIEYVSPAICDSIFSSSSGPIIVLSNLSKLQAPTGLVLGDESNGFRRLSWNRYPGALCYSVYKLVDELGPFGPYQLIAECITDNFIDLDEPGTYKITVITRDGETDFSPPIHFVGSEEPPVEEDTIEVLGELDNVEDLAMEAKIVAGEVLGDSAVYKDGIVTVLAGAGNPYAVSPDGTWVVGDDTSAGDTEFTYDFSTYRTFGAGAYFGLDVADSGSVLTTDKRIRNATTNALIATITSAGFDNPASVLNVFKMNNAQQVLVLSSNTDAHNIYRWTAGLNTKITPANKSGATSATAIGITESGAIACHYLTNIFQTHTFYNASGGVGNTVDIGDFGGFVTGRDVAEGYICGQCDNGSGAYLPFTWNPTDGIEILPLLDDMTPGSTGTAYSVNDDGWVVGEMDNKAFLYHDGVTYHLTDFLPVDSGWTSLTSAKFINNLKHVVGQGVHEGVSKWFIMSLV